MHWEIGVQWGRGSSAQEGLGQEMGFDLSSKKRDRIQQVGMQGVGNLTGPDSKGKGGRIPDGKPSGRRVHTTLAGVSVKWLRL